MRLDQLHPERWKLVKEIAADVLDASEEGRDFREILDRKCGDDVDLREEVVAAVRTFSGHDDSLFGARRPGELLTGPDVPVVKPGDRAGAYRIEKELGRGGMGSVYLASRADEAFSKTVAIKTVAGHISQQALDLFLHERRILALLDHPHITRILDAGTLAGGVPYVVMEYVVGSPITDFAKARGLDARGVAELFVQVCEAVQYAHTNTVLHCDLKPQNILVTDDGHAYVLDFGLAQYSGAAAKALGLTRAYASPEQIGGQQLTTLSDVYSLGAILRELVESCKNPPADLQAIVRRSLAEESGRRYPSAAAMALDLGRMLRHEPVEAVNGGRWYRAKRYAQRHQWRVAGGIALLLATGLGVAGTIGQRRVAERRFADIRGLARAVVFEYQEELARIQGSTALRARIAGDTVRYLDRIAEDSARDDSLRREIALAYRKVAEAEGYQHTGNIGDVKGASESLAKSVAVWKPLLASKPDDEELTLQLAIALERQANVLSLAGKNRDARATALESLRVAGELRGAKGAEARSAANRELSASLLSLGLTTEGIEAARRAVTEAAAQTNRECRALANLQLSRAILLGIGPNRESLDQARRAGEGYESCKRGDSVCTVGRLSALVSLARHYTYSDQPDDALRAASKAETEALAALSSDGNDWRVWRLLRNSRSLQGDAYRDSRRKSEALEKYRATVATSTRMAENDPDHPEAACLVISSKARFGEVLVQDFGRVPEAERELREAVALADAQKSDNLQCLDSRKMAVLNMARVAEGKGDWEGGMEWRRETVRNAIRYARQSSGEPLALVIEAGANYELGLGGMEAAKRGKRTARLEEARNALLRSRAVYVELAKLGNPIQNQYDGWPARVERMIAEIERLLRE